MNKNYDDFSSTKVKKTIAPHSESASGSKILIKKIKTTHPISHIADFNELHEKIVSADSSFQKYIHWYAKTENHNLGIEYHEVDFESFKKSPYWCKFAALNVASHKLVWTAQQIKTVVPGYSIHALYHVLKYSEFDILAKNVLGDAQLKLIAT